MTVIRLADARLLLHSPVALDPQLRTQLDSIGRVCFAVAPNRLHHLYVGDVARAYPGVRLWVAPGLERKRPDLVFEAVLDDEAPEEWRGVIDQTFFRGRPYENEVTFFHRPSRTLILCDLAFNFGPRAAAPTRLLMKLLRSYGHLGPSKLAIAGPLARASSAFSRGTSTASSLLTATCWRAAGTRSCAKATRGCSHDGRGGIWVEIQPQGAGGQ
jgi:hypothetical protein